MKRKTKAPHTTRKTAILVLLVLLSTHHAFAEEKKAEQSPPWKAGVATVVITPEQDMWMAGYGGRKKPSGGVVQQLHAKALALEDPSAVRFVVVTMDLIGVLRELRDSVAREVEEKLKLPPAYLLLNGSHTHCGPEYRPRKGREKEAQDYRAMLEKSLVKVIGEALDDLEPANVSYARARCGFAMNRRKNYSLSSGDPLVNRAPTFDGPVDHEVPVLWITDAEGEAKAVLFTYACHATTLSSTSIPPDEPVYKINGDYPGFAQQILQEAYPTAAALFLNGCSADQNPYPRRGQVPGKLPLELAEHHGRTLAYSVIAAAPVAGVRPVTGGLYAAIEDVELARNNDKPAHDHPVQVVLLGDQVTLVALGSESTIDYSLRLKREIDCPLVWVAGYCNDYSGYVPGRRVAQEGGYEASNNFTLDVEERIVGKAHELVGRLNADKMSGGIPAKSEIVP
jgi:hypothetical protein